MRAITGRMTQNVIGCLATVMALSALARALPGCVARHARRAAHTLPPTSKVVGVARRLRPVPSGASPSVEASSPPNFSMEIRDPVLAPASPLAEPSPIPSSIPEAPAGFQWHWAPGLRSAMLVPAGWHVWSGDGELFGMPTHQVVVSLDAAVPTADSPHAVGLSVKRYAQAFTQSVVKTDHESFAEFLAGMHVRRTGPAAPPVDPAAEPSPEEYATAVNAMVEAIHGGEEGGAGQAQPNGPHAPVAVDPSAAAAAAAPAAPPSALAPAEGSPVHVLDSWRHEVTKGVSLWGIEYTSPHSDLADPARRAQGMRYYLSIVLNTPDNCVYEVEFRAPAGEWPQVWARWGTHQTEQLFLNWADESPAKFS